MNDVLGVDSMNEMLFQAINGNDLAREKMIQHYKPYIINSAGSIVGRFITWSDEEASIALLAFNRAIDTYERSKGRTFLNYAYLLIKRDLIDFYRKEKRQIHPPIHITQEQEDYSTNQLETKKSLESYEQSLQKHELVEEILELSELLKQFNISFHELENFSPKHHDTRETVMKMARDFINERELVDEFLRKKRLPVTAFAKQFGYRKKTIERHRKYLVTIILLLNHPEWRKLNEYIQKPKEREAYEKTENI